MEFSNIIAIVLIILFIVFYVYKNSFAKKVKATVKWFYRKNCGHCRNMESEWDRFVTMAPTDIAIEKINILENQELAKAYNVQGVPYIVAEKPDLSKVVYNGDRTAEDLLRFSNGIV
jgi:thiol-disulfide isomerase/thioredoxin